MIDPGEVCPGRSRGATSERAILGRFCARFGVIFALSFLPISLSRRQIAAYYWMKIADLLHIPVENFGFPITAEKDDAMALRMLYPSNEIQVFFPSDGREKNYEGIRMNETPNVRLGPREKQIVELLLQGCDNAEIASQLNMARRTVKAHFNRLFLRFGITGGIKRVKLATLLYRRQSCLQMNAMEAVSQANGNGESSNLLPKA